MLDIDLVLNRIRAFRKATGMSYAALALSIGRSRASLVGMDRRDWAPNTATIRELEAVIPSGWQPGDPLPSTPKSKRAA